MEYSFVELREKEVVSILSGKRLGHICDVVFDFSSGRVLGIVVPGEKKLFRKTDDMFIALSYIERIGDDCVLVRVETEEKHDKKTIVEQSGQESYAPYARKLPKI